MFTKRTTLSDVHRIKRPGVGHVYVGRISIGDLYVALMDGDISYSPKYQRGYRPSLDLDDVEYDRLVNIDDDRLLIDHDRAATMAAKYLMAVNAIHNKMLYNPEIIWNARQDTRRDLPQYDADKRELQIFTKLTIPDSGHRHYAYYLLGTWKNDPDTIPSEVEVEENGEVVTSGNLTKWLANFDPFDAEESSVLVHVFTIDKQLEGRLFDEYNEEGKKPSNAASIDMYQDKTPSRRFITKLMKACPIFARTEIETRTNTIGSKSRKLTTNATLDSAIKPYSKDLLALEQDGGNAHDDVVTFFCAFYEEWAKHYPEFQPTTDARERHELRRRSLAIQNIMFFPMFRLAFELWRKYRADGVDWGSSTEWKDGLARLGGTVKIDLNGHKKSVPVMARDMYDADDKTKIVEHGNPAWQGRILLQTFDSKGNPAGWSLSSTRQTRDAAFHYIADIAGVDVPSRRPAKSP